MASDSELCAAAWRGRYTACRPAVVVVVTLPPSLLWRSPSPSQQAFFYCYLSTLTLNLGLVACRERFGNIGADEITELPQGEFRRMPMRGEGVRVRVCHVATRGFAGPSAA